MKAGFPISKIIASNTIFGPLVDYHGYYTQTRVYVPQIWGYSSHYCIPQIWGYSLHYCTTDMELQLTLLYHRYRLQSSHGVIFLLPYPAQCTLIHVYESGTHVSAYQLISH